MENPPFSLTFWPNHKSLLLQQPPHHLLVTENNVINVAVMKSPSIWCCLVFQRVIINAHIAWSLISGSVVVIFFSTKPGKKLAQNKAVNLLHIIVCRYTQDFFAQVLACLSLFLWWIFVTSSILWLVQLEKMGIHPPTLVFSQAWRLHRLVQRPVQLL